MGSQVAILGTSEDLSELLAVARKQGARAVPELVPEDEIPELQDPEELFRAHPNERLYLLPGDLAAAEIFTIAGSNRPDVERVNDRTSPVVEVVPPIAEGQSMRAGRLYLGLSPTDSQFRSAKRLFDVMKKSAESWARAQPGNIRVGPRAVERARQQDLSLASTIGERITLTEDKER